jgi:hypothetical protein
MLRSRIGLIPAGVILGVIIGLLPGLALFLLVWPLLSLAISKLRS